MKSAVVFVAAAVVAMLGATEAQPAHLRRLAEADPPSGPPPHNQEQFYYPYGWGYGGYGYGGYW